MAKKECPSCAVWVERDESVCPICGYEFPQSKRSLKIVALVLVILFLWPLMRIILRLLGIR